MTWWVAGLSFLGALVGSGIPAWVSLRHQRQTAHTEWRERLDRATDLALSTHRAQRLVGRELLTELIRSDLGSGEDRALARRVAGVLLPADRPGRPGADGGQ